MFGVDYMLGEFTIDTSPESDIDSTDLGVFIGYEFPILFKIYYSHFFDSSADSSTSSNDIEGSGAKIGIGYTGLPFIAINFEMISRCYDETDNGFAINPEIEVDTFAINISLPLP